MGGQAAPINRPRSIRSDQLCDDLPRAEDARHASARMCPGTDPVQIRDIWTLVVRAPAASLAPHRFGSVRASEMGVGRRAEIARVDGVLGHDVPREPRHVPVLQIAHDCIAERARGGRTHWPAIALFYEQLVSISPTLGTQIGYAAAVAEAKGSEAGLAVLDAIDAGAVLDYQPYWAVRAHLLQRLGKASEAADAFERAIGLAEDPAVREFLLQRRG